MKAKGSSFFWPSFTDLMTSLFFIMLVLYVLTYLKLTNQQKATEQQLNKIKEIQNAVKELPREYFQYDSIYKRFSLVQNIEFEDGKEFLLWEDAKEYHNEDFETESVFLIGPGGSIKLIEHINLRAMVLLGTQVKHQENQFFYKVGFGLKYIF